MDLNTEKTCLTDKCATILKSVAVYILFISLGFGYSTWGPTLVSIEILLDTNMQTLSWAITCIAVGALVGASLCSLTFDRGQQEVQLSVAAFMEGGALAVAPLFGNVYAFLAMVTLSSLGHGFVSSAGNSYVFNLWKGSTRKEPFMQGAHATWCVGAALGPLIIHHFLVPIETDQHNASEASNFSLTTVINAEKPPGINRVTYAYAILGSLIVACGLINLLIYLVIICKHGTKSKVEQCKNNTKVKKNWKLSAFEIKFILLLLPQFFIVSTLEPGLISFIAPFAVKSLGWGNQVSSLLVTVVLVAFFVGRLLSIPISAFLTPLTMVLINITGMILSLVLMCFVQYSDIIVWLTVAMAGLFLATAFPTTILWGSVHLKLSGFITGIFVIGMQVSSLIFPPLFGLILQKTDGMPMIYILLSVTVVQLLIAIALIIFIRYNVKNTDKMGTDDLCHEHMMKPITMDVQG